MPPGRLWPAIPAARPKELDDVQQLARDKSIDAINTLAAIHADMEQPPSARVAAANAILDRAFGKASAAGAAGAAGATGAAGEGGERPDSILASIKVEFVRPDDGSGQG
jgi:hypothetical protein